MSVSARTRLPAATALSNIRCDTARVAPASRARASAVAHLAENLALPQGHRLEAGRDAEEMPRGVGALAVEARARDLRRIEAAPARDEAGDLFLRPLAVREGVDLAAVTGRDDHALGREAVAPDALEGFAHLVGVESDPLAHRRFRAAEVPAQKEQPALGGAHRKRCACVRYMLTTVYENRTTEKPRIERSATRGPSHPRRSIQRSRPYTRSVRTAHSTLGSASVGPEALRPEEAEDDREGQHGQADRDARAVHAPEDLERRQAREERPRAGRGGSAGSGSGTGPRGRRRARMRRRPGSRA